MRKTIKKHSVEQGSVLLWGLVVLLVLTVIGIAASRMAAVDSRIAGNQMMFMLTYQGADSMLRQSISLFNVVKTATTGESPEEYDARRLKVMDLPDFSDPDSRVTATGEASVGEDESCPPLEGIAISTEMTPDAGGVACRVFTAHAAAALPGTGARSRHSEGAIKLVPSIP